MTEKRTDYVILGLLSHEDLTGYEIKRRIDASLSYFWGASFGSIYPTLKDLVERGLAERTSDSNSPRNKQVYHITDMGREALKQWLAESECRDEVRYETLLKLFFGSAIGSAQTKRHIAAFREKTQNDLNRLLEAKKNLEDCLGDDDAHRYYYLTVLFGIKTYSAYLGFCDDALSLLVDQNYDSGE